MAKIKFFKYLDGWLNLGPCMCQACNLAITYKYNLIMLTFYSNSDI